MVQQPDPLRTPRWTQGTPAPLRRAGPRRSVNKHPLLRLFLAALLAVLALAGAGSLLGLG